MLKLLVLLLTFCSCQTSRPIPAGADPVATLQKKILLKASSQAAANEAQVIIPVFFVPNKVEITAQEQGSILLRFNFLINFPQRFSQMMEQLAQVPGLVILKE